MITTDTTPPRKGAYIVTLANGETCFAQWEKAKGAAASSWFKLHAETPTDEKVLTPLLETVVGFRKAATQEVTQAYARELTMEEKIAKAFDRYGHRLPQSNGSRVPMPLRRKLPIGTEVAIGLLRGCKVVGTSEDGTLLAVSQEESTGTKVEIWHWSDVLPKQAPAYAEPFSAVDTIYDRMTLSTWSLEGACNGLFSGRLTGSVDFQRDYVWTDADKDAFLDSVIQQRELGRVIIANQPFPAPSLIIDGKQRLYTLAELFGSIRPYRGLYWEELHARDRLAFESRGIQVASIDKEVSRVELLKLFLAANVSGVPQTEAHLDKVKRLLVEASTPEA